MPGNDRAESEDTSQDEKTGQLGLRGSNNYFCPAGISGLPLFAHGVTLSLILVHFFAFWRPLSFLFL